MTKTIVFNVHKSRNLSLTHTHKQAYIALSLPHNFTCRNNRQAYIAVPKHHMAVGKPLGKTYYHIRQNNIYIITGKTKYVTMSIRQNNVYYGIRKTIYITVSGKTTYITVSVRLETRCHDAITAVYDARHVYDRLAVVLLIAKHY